MQIADQTVVSIDYTLKNDAGQVLDTSEGREPLAYLHGAGNIVPGLEEQLTGKTAGDEVSVAVPPEKGYGERSEKLIQPVPRSNFAGVDDIQVGQQFQAQTPQGPRVVTVTEVGDDSVTVDANHPLAGETLNFEIKIVDVREASQEEIDHGHAHGAGGHQH